LEKIMNNKTYVNPFENDLKCYKTNLHCHSTTSDGQFSWKQLGKLYRSRGYDVIAMTDHCKANHIPEDDSGISWISGIEFHPQGPRGIVLHLVGLNVPENFPDPSKLPFQDAIQSVRDAGGECFVAHPYWNGLTSKEVAAIRDVIGVEVYNTSTRYIGKAFNMQLWDELLDEGKILSAFAVDDTHAARDLFRGWTMICAEDKTPQAIMKAIKAGTCYSTMGPEFQHMSLSGRKIRFEFTPCVEAVIICDKNHGLDTFCPGDDVVVTDGQLVLSGKRETTVLEDEIPNDIKYARCQIKDANGNYAWSNPFIFS